MFNSEVFDKFIRQSLKAASSKRTRTFLKVTYRFSEQFLTCFSTRNYYYYICNNDTKQSLNCVLRVK